MTSFLIGLIVGIIGTFIVSYKSSAKIKKAKEAVETEYQSKIAEIEKDRAAKVAELQEKKTAIEELKKQLDTLTLAEAKAKLSPESQQAIQDIINKAKGATS